MSPEDLVYETKIYIKQDPVCETKDVMKQDLYICRITHVSSNPCT